MELHFCEQTMEMDQQKMAMEECVNACNEDLKIQLLQMILDFERHKRPSYNKENFQCMPFPSINRVSLTHTW